MLIMLKMKKKKSMNNADYAEDEEKKSMNNADYAEDEEKNFFFFFFF